MLDTLGEALLCSCLAGKGKGTVERLESKGSKRAIIIAWGAVLICMALIFYFSSQSSLGGMKWPPVFQALRKSSHIVEYGTLGVLIGIAIIETAAYRGLSLTRALYRRAWWVGVGLATLYAASDEFHQSFVPHRGAHFEDVVIDALSATAVLGIWFIIKAPSGGRALNPRQAGEGTTTELRPETK